MSAPLLLLLLLGAGAVCMAGTPPTVKVLFVGNSLTYVNDLPGKLQSLCDSPTSVIRVQSSSSVMVRRTTMICARACVRAADRQTKRLSDAALMAS